MTITLEGKRIGRFYLAWKLFWSAVKMLVNGVVEIEFRAASETPNVEVHPTDEAGEARFGGSGGTPCYALQAPLGSLFTGNLVGCLVRFPVDNNRRQKHLCFFLCGQHAAL